jgi:hypothetical protein
MTKEQFKLEVKEYILKSEMLNDLFDFTVKYTNGEYFGGIEQFIDYQIDEADLFYDINIDDEPDFISGEVFCASIFDELTEKIQDIIQELMDAQDAKQI